MNTIFISYCHEDEVWKNHIQSHLNVLERHGKFNIWDDRRIPLGGDWLEDIEQSLEKASIALLLISRHFLSSDFILNKEIPSLLHRRAQSGLQIIPIILTPCSWQSVTWLAAIQGYPKDNQPLSGMTDHQVDETLTVLANQLLEGIQCNVQSPDNKQDTSAQDITERNAFIGEYGPIDWLSLKQEILDQNSFNNENILPLLRSYGQERENLTVLDCGSGEGQFTEILRETINTQRVTGLEIYGDYIAKAKQLFPDSTNTYVQGDIYDAPFADNSFDIVASQSTFDILNGPLMFKEMVRLLKPGGWLYISMAYNSSYPFSPEFDRKLDDKIHRNFDKYGVEWGKRGAVGEGDSRCGRKLWQYAKDYDLEVLKYVPSDWILYPKPVYTLKEKAVLNLLVDFYFQASLRAKDNDVIKRENLVEWKDAQQARIRANELTLISHQSSLLAKKRRNESPIKV